MMYTDEQVDSLNPTWIGLPRGEALIPQGQFVLMSMTLWNKGRETVEWQGASVAVATIAYGQSIADVDKSIRFSVDNSIEKLIRPEPKIIHPGTEYQTHVVFDIPKGRKAIGVFLTDSSGKTTVYVSVPALG